MSRTDDTAKAATHKLTPEEEAALEKFYEQSKAKHGGRFVTLLKSGRIAEQIQKERMRERRETPVQWSEIETRAREEKKWKYGRADWSPPDLTMPPPKQPPAALWNALGQFVNLSDKRLDSFRERYPEFFPAWFYTLPYDVEPLAWQAWRSLLREAWQAGFHPEYVAQLVNIPTMLPGDTVCDAQRAVLAMMLESWRARFCPRCGRPFVARKAADKYSPKECFAEQRREKQRASKRKRARRRAKSLRRTMQ